MSVSARLLSPAALPRATPAPRRGGRSDPPRARRRVFASSTIIDDDDASVSAYDRARLEADASAMRAQRERMTDALERKTADVDDAARDDPHGEWKWAIRKRIWDRMEDTNVAQFPRPVHHRIPNFVNADKAAANLTALQCFKDAECVKVNPDTPQKAVRRAVLEAGKTLMTPQPRLRTGFFSILSEKLVPAIADQDAEVLKKCCTSAGVASHGVPLSLDEMRAAKCDLLVIGSCAVDVKSGARLGKGEGFAELEYAIMRMMGTIDDSTLVVTTVHDTQLLDGGEIDTRRLLRHDVPVDLIVTPTRTIRIDKAAQPAKPEGIYWDILSPQKLAQVKVLRDLRAEVEATLGVTLPRGPDETLPPLAVRAEKKKMREASRGGGGGRGGRRGGGRGARRGRS